MKKEIERARPRSLGECVMSVGRSEDAETVTLYLQWRRARGADGLRILGEHPLAAWIEINIFLGRVDRAHIHRPEIGYVPSARVAECFAALHLFYDAIARAGLRTAGDPFTALEDFAAVPAGGQRRW